MTVTNREASVPEQRQAMVNDQLKARGIQDPRVLDAFLQIPREDFVPEEYRSQAYSDHPFEIGNGQTISQPYTVAFMTELLQLTPTDQVLEIGSGSGYQASLLAEIVKDGRVFTVERIANLAKMAEENIRRAGYKNVTTATSDGTLGLPAQSPFNAIIVTAAAPRIPKSLIEQLAINGRLVIPVGSRWVQDMVCVTKVSETDFKTEFFGNFVFVPLLGKEGW